MGRICFDWDNDNSSCIQFSPACWLGLGKIYGEVYKMKRAGIFLLVLLCFSYSFADDTYTSVMLATSCIGLVMIFLSLKSPNMLLQHFFCILALWAMVNAGGLGRAILVEESAATSIINVIDRGLMLAEYGAWGYSIFVAFSLLVAALNFIKKVYYKTYGKKGISY